MKKISRELSTGTLTLSIEPSLWLPEQLFDFAQRQNPKRAFLFVSKILGKHIPVSPAIMRQSYKDLAAKINPKNTGNVLFIGMAETAVGLAAGVFEEASKKIINSLFLTTTRHPIAGDLLCEFKEEHSHATDHLIYHPINTLVTNDFFQELETIVLIDDEMTTGNTFINLINSLYSNPKINFNNVKEIITVTITNWSNNQVKKNHFNRVNINDISLMNGSWQWQANPDAILPKMPNVNTSSQGLAKLSARQDWGRLGVTQFNHDHWLEKFSAKTNEKILVLGTGEFLFPAFKVAEKLEKLGANVVFSSTTRSPIAQGLAIKSSLSFSDNYGQNIPNFCYNIAHNYYDRIILCVETPTEFIDKLLIEQLSKIAHHLDIAYYD